MSAGPLILYHDLHKSARIIKNAAAIGVWVDVWFSKLGLYKKRAPYGKRIRPVVMLI